MTGAAMSKLAFEKGFDSGVSSNNPLYLRELELFQRRADTASRIAGDLVLGREQARKIRLHRRRESGDGRSNPTWIPSRSFSVNDLSDLSITPGRSCASDSFLLYTARTLRMDLGELWTLNLSSSLELQKLYIAPHFYERHSARIVYPEADRRANPSAQHRFSRDLCMRAVLKGEPMWCDVTTATEVGGALAATAAPASEEAVISTDLPLRTAVVIPFNTVAGASSSSTCVLVLYSQRYQPLPPREVMLALLRFSRTVVTEMAMVRLLHALATELAAAIPPNRAVETHSVVERLGLTSSASLPACLHALERPAAVRNQRERRCSGTVGTCAAVATPTIAPPAPQMRESTGSTFAQRRMRQMMETQCSAECTA